MIRIRRVIPLLVLPLALIACALANAPWLRAFPSAIISVPLFGAALLSVIAPVIVFGIGVRRLWLAALIDIALFVFYELLVTLREPGGFNSLYNGLVHGPSQLLTFALPLVSPRILLVAPVALCWLGGAIVGECIARGWQTVVPYLTLLVVFGLSYAASARAISNSDDAKYYDTVLAAALLLTLLLLRTAQAWVAQDDAAEAVEPTSLLPLRGLAIGTSLSVLVALAAAGIAQSSAFSGPPTAPARTPPIERIKPFTPLSFIAAQRPGNPKSAGRTLFTLTTDRASSNYVSIASVDYYDGDGWSFDRTFRPTGGVIPGDADPTLRPKGGDVTQQYTIDAGALTTTPWMPYLYRPAKVSGLSVDIDTDSGMVVPSRHLRAGDGYTVRSAVATTPFSTLKTGAVPAGYTQATLQLPTGSVKTALGALVISLARETGTSSAAAVPFLQAVTKDFRTNFGLAGGPPPRPSSSASHSAGSSRSSAASSPAAPSSTPAAAQRAGGTSFADVLASIRQFRSATPEQYATLMCLVARQIGVPARVVTGFRIPPPKGSTTLPAGRYTVRTAQAWTWVEVPISGQGWVVLDPSPGTYAGQRPQPTTGVTPSQTAAPSPTQNAQITPANTAGHAVAPKSKTPGTHHVAATSVLIIILVTLAVLALLFLAFLLARKRVRSGRRRAGDPRRRLLGAWQESLDLLEESGLPDLTYLTSREVSKATAERFGPEPAEQVGRLGDAANVAIFSPTTPVSVDEADEAWDTHAGLSRSIRDRLDWRARIGAGLRYHRTGNIHTPVGPSSWSAAAHARTATLTSRRGAHTGRSTGR